MDGWWCVRNCDALAWVEAPSAPAAPRRSLELHPLGDSTDDMCQLAVCAQDAYPNYTGPHDYTRAVIHAHPASHQRPRAPSRRQQSPSRSAPSSLPSLLRRRACGSLRSGADRPALSIRSRVWSFKRIARAWRRSSVSSSRGAAHVPLPLCRSAANHHAGAISWCSRVRPRPVPPQRSQFGLIRPAGDGRSRGAALMRWSGPRGVGKSLLLQSVSNRITERNCRSIRYAFCARVGLPW